MLATLIVQLGGGEERFSTCNEMKMISSVDMSSDIDQVNSAACRNSFP